jgi:hypothetical protein
MQRWTTVALGLLLTVAVVVVVFKTGISRSKPPDPAVSASASPKAAPPTPAASEVPVEAVAELPREDAGRFDRLPDGAPVPELPSTAPKSVGFGVILFGYEGAQGASPGAPSRSVALTKARSVIELAKKDFAEAVKQGDRGSTSDAGRIPRGVLEPSVEHALFTLEKGEVRAEPVDTPRGFWVVRRRD